MFSRDSVAHAVDYNLRVLQQVLDLIDRFAPQPGVFAEQVGPHLRHVVEHYEEFLNGLAAHVIDYDARVRDRAAESDPRLAAQRFAAVARRLGEIDEASLPESIAVSQQGGPEGAERFIALSSPLRELLFLASHAVHHFAVLRPALERSGFTLSPDFGKAPGTVRHERAVGA